MHKAHMYYVDFVPFALRRRLEKGKLPLLPDMAAAKNYRKPICSV